MTCGIITVLKPVNTTRDFTKENSDPEYTEVLSLRFSDSYVRERDLRLEDLNGHKLERKVKVLKVKGYDFTKYKVRLNDYDGQSEIYSIIRCDEDSTRHFLFLYLERVKA